MTHTSMIRVSQKDRPVSSSPLYMNVARYSTRCILYHFFCPVPYINLKLPFHARPIRQTRRCSRESHDTWSMHANATVGWRRSKRHGRASASSPIWSGSRKLSVVLIPLGDRRLHCTSRYLSDRPLQASRRCKIC